MDRLGTIQGSHRSFETAWEVMEFNCRSWKVMENKLLQMAKQGQRKIKTRNQTARTTHILVD